MSPAVTWAFLIVLIAGVCVAVAAWWLDAHPDDELDLIFDEDRARVERRRLLAHPPRPSLLGVEDAVHHPDSLRDGSVVGRTLFERSEGESYGLTARGPLVGPASTSRPVRDPLDVR